MTCLEDRLIENILDTINQGKKKNWSEYLIKLDLIKLIKNYESYIINELRADIEAEIRDTLNDY